MEGQNRNDMKRIIGAVLCSLALTTAAYAQRNTATVDAPTVESYIKEYRFNEAEELIQKNITQLKRKRKSTAQEEEWLQEISKMRSLMNATERITFIDSFVVDKASFLSHIRLSPESGTIGTTAAFFNRTDGTDGTLYRSEIGNKVCFAQPDKDNAMRLYTADLTGEGWTAPNPLEELDGDDVQNYPFMLSDGITLYYGAQSTESLGGYDIFVTRYDSGEKQFLQPENIGMPYNSPANDYMLAIDEYNRLGWLVTDRNQPEGKVCIYVFLPNDTRRIYDTNVVEEKELRRLARIERIADTWTLQSAVNEGRARLAEVMNGIRTEQQRKDFDFVVNDRITYTLLSEFRSPEAGKMARTWLEGNKRQSAQEAELKKLRDQYAQSNPTRKKSLAKQITALETQCEKGAADLNSLEKKIRAAEITALK